MLELSNTFRKYQQQLLNKKCRLRIRFRRQRQSRALQCQRPFQSAARQALSEAAAQFGSSYARASCDPHYHMAVPGRTDTDFTAINSEHRRLHLDARTSKMSQRTQLMASRKSSYRLQYTIQIVR